MGNFYTNITLKGPAQEAVVDYLQRLPIHRDVDYYYELKLAAGVLLGTYVVFFYVFGGRERSRRPAFISAMVVLLIAGVLRHGPAPLALLSANTSPRSAFVTPTTNGATVVYDWQCDSMEEAVLSGLARKLSAQFHCPSWSVGIADDDVLWYELYVDGRRVDKYDSTPDWDRFTGASPTGGDAAALCQAFAAPQAVKQVEAILRRPHGEGGYEVEVERHEALTKALGLPPYAVGSGYSGIARGDEVPGLKTGSLVRVGPERDDGEGGE